MEELNLEKKKKKKKVKKKVKKNNLIVNDLNVKIR